MTTYGKVWVSREYLTTGALEGAIFLAKGAQVFSETATPLPVKPKSAMQLQCHFKVRGMGQKLTRFKFEGFLVLGCWALNIFVPYLSSLFLPSPPSYFSVFLMAVEGETQTEEGSIFCKQDIINARESSFFFFNYSCFMGMNNSMNTSPTRLLMLKCLSFKCWDLFILMT